MQNWDGQKHGQYYGRKEGNPGCRPEAPPIYESYVLGKVSLSLLMKERDNCTFLLAFSNDKINPIKCMF